MKKMVKKLMGCVREYRTVSVLTPILIVGEVLLECAIPFVIAKLIEKIEGGCSVIETAKFGGVLVIMAIFSLLFGALAGTTASKASCGFAKNIRHDVFYKIQDFSFKNIDKFSTPSLVTRLTTDITNVQMAYMMIIRMAVRGPLMIIFSFTMAIVMGGKLALIYVLLLPMLAFAFICIVRKVMPIFRRAFRKYDRLNETVQENVRGMRVVKSFVREKYETDKFTAASEDVCIDLTRAEKIIALNSPILQLCIYLNMVLILFFGSKIILTTGSMGVGQLSAMVTYGFQILASIMMISMVFVMITMSLESAERIVEVLDEQPTIRRAENPIMQVTDGSIDFENVSFKYSEDAEKNALEGIALHIKSGETIGIIGGTGSSKSSLVQLIPRLYDATGGTVKVGGTDVKNYDIATLRNAVAVVLQKNELFSGTIADNLRWGNPDATDEELREACKMAAADDFIESFPDGYDTYIEQGGTNVSGGQKQRICIARALLKKPKVLILDDSTSAVDTKTDAMIRAAFASYIPETTKIIIAQRISSVESADRIVVMDDGKINAVGTHSELLAENEIYRDVYESQNKAGVTDEE